MASLMFRSKADNKFYSEEKRPKDRGTWYVFYYDIKGKKVRQRIGSNKHVAELAKGDIEAKLEKQRGGLLDPDKELKRITLASFKERLTDFLQTENKAPKTIKRYCGVFKNLYEFITGNDPYLRYLDQIDSHLIERYKDNRRQKAITSNGHPNAPVRQGVSVRTLNNELTFLHTVFNLAQRRGYLKANPCDEIGRICGEKKKKYEPLNKEQIQRLLQAADSSFQPIVLTFLLTGMRTGELINMEWDDIDFAKNEIHIRFKSNWQPKDKEARTLPLHKDLKPVLLEMKEKSNSPYVFGKGDKPCPNKLLIRLKRTCRRAGVNQITVHNLRDEFASHLVMNGVGIETVSKLLGHSNIQITWNHYIHLAPNRLKEAVERLEW